MRVPCAAPSMATFSMAVDSSVRTDWMCPRRSAEIESIFSLSVLDTEATLSSIVLITEASDFWIYSIINARSVVPSPSELAASFSPLGFFFRFFHEYVV